MSASTSQNQENWINRRFGVPSVPAQKSEHYPFSLCPTPLKYRLKVGLLLACPAYLLSWAEQPCVRLYILLNCWLFLVTCEYVYRNYPWREPLTDWLWNFRLKVPHWGFVCTFCFVVALLSWYTLGSGCRLSYPPSAALVGWLCLMTSWPLVAEYWWPRVEATANDYHQFSSIRPCSLTLPRPVALLVALLRSPSLLAFVALVVATRFVSLFLHGWVAEVWTLSTLVVIIACMGVLCCHRLPVDVEKTLGTWKEEEAEYAKKIMDTLAFIKENLKKKKMPQLASTRFDRLAIQVPLLQREAAILLKESRNLDESRAEELRKLTNHWRLREFRRRLDTYGPYTSNCCVS